MWPRLLQCRAAGAGGIAGDAVAGRCCQQTATGVWGRARQHVNQSPEGRAHRSPRSVHKSTAEQRSLSLLSLQSLSPRDAGLSASGSPLPISLSYSRVRRQRISTIILSFITICLNPESIWRSLWIQVPCFFLYPFSWYLSLGYVYLNKMMCKYERGNCEELATGIVR